MAKDLTSLDYSLEMRPQIAEGIKAMNSENNEPFVVLRYATSQGLEFPDAVAIVSRLMRLTPDQREEMEACYDENY